MNLEKIGFGINGCFLRIITKTVNAIRSVHVPKVALVPPPVGVGAGAAPTHFGCGCVFFGGGGSKMKGCVSSAPARADRGSTCTNVTARSPKHLANALKEN